mmetsp:Transcript_6356/g.16248  ORF Transcript_6356/g.16248 Transcript_6356/m.16248 type:complete len:281 (-) Transcript_6356:271-1113(-)
MVLAAALAVAALAASGVRPPTIVQVVPMSQPGAGGVVDRFCRSTNALCKQSVSPRVRNAVELRAAESLNMPKIGPFALVRTAVRRPESPGVPRPVWLVVGASVPTLLGWYAYYKFAVEEELFWDELRTRGRVSGCGGYGTLLPFVYAVLLGGLGEFVHAPNADRLIEFGTVWILLSQINLYRRVNELAVERGDEAPLHEWWALLPPPLDVIVGLRQVHFLAEHWAAVRGVDLPADPFATRWFPFISAPRFTVKELARTPSLWFWFTADMADFELPLLQDD